MAALHLPPDSHIAVLHICSFSHILFRVLIPHNPITFADGHKGWWKSRLTEALRQLQHSLPVDFYFLYSQRIPNMEKCAFAVVLQKLIFRRFDLNRLIGEKSCQSLCRISPAIICCLYCQIIIAKAVLLDELNYTR